MEFKHYRENDEMTYIPMSGTACDDLGTFSAMMSWKTVIDSSTVITANNATATERARAEP